MSGWTLILVLSLHGVLKAADVKGYGSEEACWIAALKAVDEAKALPRARLADAMCVAGNL